ncbi:NAD(P)-binding protein [Guyanagaster necrorhizus]|uniref:NAD(P)-binding protein n=1 Tax=Guyanagaster necrorhizus TaxID=856835 RepID=A0A9P8AV04_9AGAR|nr:NAD(P)-binding protein [Guyanagaster necrorhizus MCA 3950]KAG7448805.1 NAD(P)-binding protein [Guyanagaster necrorhizus MCA 3950]
MASERILVTGATGFLGSHVVVKALESGYSVRGTVRSPSKAQEVLTCWSSYGNRFDTAVVPDLMNGDYSEALKGISAVIHVASPFIRSVDDPKKDLLDPARQGTLKVLEACLKHGVRRVIVTGSIAAVIDPTKGGLWREYTCTAEDWNPLTYELAVSGALPGVGVYAVSKKIAEEAAFEFDREHPEMRITVMSPTMIYGPLVLPADLSALNTSSQDIYNLISGKLEETGLPAYTDVRDVAALHVKALKVDSVIGKRVLVNGGMYTFYEAVNILREKRPNFAHRLPSLDVVEKVRDPTAKIDVSIAETELGIKWISFEQCLLDTIDGFVKMETAQKI